MAALDYTRWWFAWGVWVERRLYFLLFFWSVLFHTWVGIFWLCFTVVMGYDKRVVLVNKVQYSTGRLYLTKLEK